MAEPTTNLTFQDLIKEVAILIGVAEYSGGVPVIPTDAFNLDSCKRIINNAIRMFVSNAPPTQSSWRWQRRIHSITMNATGGGPLNIDSDPGRYLLPDNFGGTINGPIIYEKDTSADVNIEWVSEAIIRKHREISTYSGYPRLAAYRPYGSRQYELLVYPNPADAYILEFPYTSFFDKLVELTDKHPAGFQFDNAILSACKARAEMEIDDISAGWYSEYKNVDLPDAHKLDNHIQATRLGKLGSGRSPYTGYYDHRRLGDVTYT